MSEFRYLIEKVNDSTFIKDPFPHLEIDNFLSKDHFNEITSDDQIHFEEQPNSESLISTLLSKKYKIQNFPGCCTDPVDYLNRLKTNNWPSEIKNTPIESYGITFRLSSYKNPKIERLVNYMNGEEFKIALENKFNIKDETSIITAIQKNLTKYEITPHPDTRRKALTYLLNINKDDSVEGYNVHTHLLKFKKEYEYIYKTWEQEKGMDRCWVPWDLCTTQKTISKNNTIVLFAPSNLSLHAVKLDYPHNKFQRTQLYGNLMYTKASSLPVMNYKALV